MLPTTPRVYVYRDPADGQWRSQVDGGLTVAIDRELTYEGGEGSPADVLAALDLPSDWPTLEAMAAARHLGDRFVKVVLGDEGPTRFASGIRLRPREWTFDTGGQFLTFLHLPLVIGVFVVVVPGPISYLEDDGTVATEPPPDGVTGTFVLGTVRLYHSALADAAWRGVVDGRLRHVSATLLRQPGQPPGAGVLAEAGLIHVPACPGARVVKWWELPE